MRSYARLLVPVLLAGTLAACSGDSGSAEGLPTVKGAYGTKPAVQIEKGSTASPKLETEILSEGDGPKVKEGDLLVADYLGKNFRSRKVFDNSYDRGTPAAFTLKSGPGGVISGWVKALKGVPVGSRVLLVAPPKDGYGKAGNEAAGIKGKDALVFVVDVIAAYGGSADLPRSTPVTDLPAGLPTVDGTTKPTVTVPDDATPPTEPKATVVATGTGEKVVEGELAVLHYTAVSWNNQPLSSTWDQGSPQGVPVTSEAGNPFSLLVDVPVGSRVLLELPAPEGAGAEESVAVVIDILGQHGPAKKGQK